MFYILRFTCRLLL